MIPMEAFREKQVFVLKGSTQTDLQVSLCLEFWRSFYYREIEGPF